MLPGNKFSGPKDEPNFAMSEMARNDCELWLEKDLKEVIRKATEAAMELYILMPPDFEHKGKPGAKHHANIADYLYDLLTDEFYEEREACKEAMNELKGPPSYE